MITRLLLSTVAIAASDLLLYVSFVGVGLGLRRLLGFRSVEAQDCLVAFWSGLATVILGLLLANFFFPISDLALLLVLLSGAVSLWLCRRPLLAIAGSLELQHLPWVVAFGLTVFWLANASLSPLENWDSALYHLQAIQWAEQYPAIPGIANLYGPLAFNNASFLYGALLNAGPWQDHAYVLANGLLVIAIVLQGFVAAYRIVNSNDSEVPVHIFTILLVVPAIVLVNPVTLPSYITDGPTTLVMLAVMPLILLEFIGTGSLRDRGFRIIVISLLLALGVCMKLHTGIFAALAWPLVIIHWIADCRRANFPWGRNFAWAATFVLVFAAAWMGRGIIQSGYPMFPLPILGAPVDWRAPWEHAAAEHAFIVHSTRASAPQHGFQVGIERFRGWMPHWWDVEVKRNPYEMIFPLALSLFAATACLAHRKRGSWKAGRASLTILLPVMGATVAWFFTAPAPRYAMYLFWTTAALFSIVYLAPLLVQRPAWQRACAALCIIFAISPAVVFPVLEAFRAGSNPLVNIVRLNFNRPPAAGLLPEIKQVDFSVFTTTSGLTLRVPLPGTGGRCWNTPVPCTPNPASNLRLRRPPDIRYGFRVNGEWQMQDWPYLWLPDFLATWRDSRMIAEPVTPQGTVDRGE